MKKKKDNFITAEKAKLNLKNLEIKISSLEQLKSKLLRLNPFSNLHTEHVSLKNLEFSLIFGSHNSWKFIEIDK
jgi:hypothetical protein